MPNEMARMEKLERVVKAMEDAIDIIQDRESINDDTRDSLKALSKEMYLWRTDPVEFLVRQMKSLKKEQRCDILVEFCTHCGDEAPCNCWRDD